MGEAKQRISCHTSNKATFLMKDIAVEVKPSVVGAAQSVAEGVNHSVKGVGDALKDTVEAVNPFLVDLVEAVKDIATNATSSEIDAVDALKDTVEDNTSSVVGVENELKDIAEEIDSSTNYNPRLIKGSQSTNSASHVASTPSSVTLLLLHYPQVSRKSTPDHIRIAERSGVKLVLRPQFLPQQRPY